MIPTNHRWVGLALLWPLLTACTAEPRPAAEVLFLGDHILTLGPETATAVAVSGERIVWLGDRADSAAWQGPETVVHELGDRALLPGFIDAHGHLTFTAQTLDMANIASPPVGPVETLADLASTLAAFIEERGIAEGEWVVGLGYDDSLIAEQRHPERSDLDAVSSTHRIALTHVSGHLMALNSLALEAVGYGPDTEDPPGGHLRREADGRTPNGVLEETALGPVRGAVVQPLDAEQTRKALLDYASYGVTTVQDGGASRSQVEELAAMARDGGLPLDVIAYQAMGRGNDELPPDVPVGEYRDRFKLGGIKLVLDGSPQGKTAFLTEPYHVPPPGQSDDYVGYPMFPAESIEQWVDRFYEAGVPILAHANGDAAADILIDAVQKAVSEHGDKDHRTVMIHAQTVREDQLDQMARLEMMPSYFSAHTFYWGDWHRDSVLGPERGSRISPTRTTKDRGMHFTVHNDTPIVPSDMIRLLWATTNRRTRSGQELGPEHALTVEEALVAMTLDAAYQSFEESEKGSIEVGKLADLVVLSRDPREGPVQGLLDLEVLATLSHGRWVHDSAGFDASP